MSDDVSMLDICWKRYLVGMSDAKVTPWVKASHGWSKLQLDRPIFLKGNFIEHLAGFSSNGKKGLKIIWGDKYII